MAVHTALRHLRQMPPAERQQVIQSDRFRSTFSDQEQKLISQLAEMSPAAGRSAEPAAKIVFSPHRKPAHTVHRAAVTCRNSVPSDFILQIAMRPLRLL